MHIHRAKENESIYDIAREYGVSPVKTAENNELEIRGRLPVGREILILTPSRTYNVKSTDTLGKIADRFKTSKDALMRLNPELQGREKLYSGQLLTIRESTPSYGMISTNGYLYAGAPKDKLISVIPYLSYVTVCSAVYKDGHVRSLYPCEETVEIIKSVGRAPMLRVYLGELPRQDEIADLASSVSILAASGGFAGITLSSLNSLTNDKGAAENIVFNLRRKLMENDLLLFAEGEIDRDTSYMDYADAGVLTYDKIHLSDTPSFDEGERAAFEAFAYASETSRSFIEIPSFAYSGGRYVEKKEAQKTADKRCASIFYDEDKKLSRASYGRHKKREIIYESLENTKAKLELLSELGFMGISFDIGRVCTQDLVMAASMFDIVCHPAMVPKSRIQDI